MTDSAGAMLRGAVDLSSLRNRPQPGNAQQVPAQQAAGGPIVDLSDAAFQQFIELSSNVPVIVELYDAAVGSSNDLADAVTSLTGRLALGRVEVHQNPAIVQAFRPQAIPMVVAVIGGAPVPLFTGPADATQINDVLGQVLQLAQQQGVTGMLPTGEEAQAAREAAEARSPLHEEAFSAIEEGDYARAEHAYAKVLEQNPEDEDARAGLGQVKLLARTQGKELQAVRDAAAASPDDVQAQFDVADLDLAGGHVEDAFQRLLDLFARSGDQQRPEIRERLLELFGLVGDTDPRVQRARQRFTSLLF